MPIDATEPYDEGNIFAQILRGDLPNKKVYEDEHVFAFEDIDPQAPTHVLVIPKRHFAGLKEAQEGDADRWEAADEPEPHD